MTLSLAGKALNIGNVFPSSLDAVDTYYKGIVSAILSLLATAPRTSLIVLVLFIGLALVNGRLLGILPTRHISMEKVSGLILSGVFVLLLGWSIPSETLDINLPGA